VDFPSGQQEFEIDTPVRRYAMKHIQREEYKAAVCNLYEKMELKEIAERPAKIMVREIEELSKLKDKSAFREVGDSI